MDGDVLLQNIQPTVSLSRGASVVSISCTMSASASMQPLASEVLEVHVSLRPGLSRRLQVLFHSNHFQTTHAHVPTTVNGSERGPTKTPRYQRSGASGRTVLIPRETPKTKTTLFLSEISSGEFLRHRERFRGSAPTADHMRSVNPTATIPQRAKYAFIILWLIGDSSEWRGVLCLI